MPERTIRSRLGQMALALLNATLLLAVLLVFGLWLLLGRLQGFAADTARTAATAIGVEAGDRLEVRTESLQATLARLSTLESRLSEAIDRAGTAESPAATELSALRGDLQSLTAAMGGLTGTVGTLQNGSAAAVRDLLHQVFLDLARRLGPVPASTLP